ncbi:hypothetical protein [Cytobacillus oceanisediminis]|uniref:hypothetical protein n=1 Tax=Cytobacillus oceanisediminis TaxID=665099 RepID=UPI001FB3062A|nr:hypothetical protein [Cytobacillus oceanisediminis]UOE58217.1 hypothetical protein IRB79_27330 [Cytobacillus oceanisediminis]
MAGLKNVYQIYGATPFEAVKGETIWERDLNLQAREYTPYCRYCGGEIVDAQQDSNGHKADPEWERLNQTHYRCYRERAHW